MTADHLVGDGAQVTGNLNEVLLGIVNTFPYGIGKVQSLPKPCPNFAVSVADNNQRAEAAPAAALDGLGYRSDAYYFVSKLFLRPIKRTVLRGPILPPLCL